MAYNPSNNNGQATAANSAPVVLASDQFPLASTISDASTITTGTTIETVGMVYNGATWDRMRAISSATGTTTDNTTTAGLLGAGVGPGFNVRYNPSNLGTASASTSTFVTNGASSMMLTVGTTTTGTFTIEGTGDGTNWGFPEVFDGTNDLWVTGANLTPTLGTNYQILSGNYRAIRLRTTATLGATMAHTFTASLVQHFLGGIDTGPAPHNFGYTIFHKDITTGATLTTVTLQTPPTGKKFAVSDITVAAGGTTAGIVTIYDAVAATAFTSGTTPAILRAELAPSTTSRPGITKNYQIPYVSTTANNSIIITTSAAINPLYVQLNGYYI
jgi:hypothetical protein